MLDWTVQQARDWLEPRKRKGAHCPCCDQLARIYKRTIHSAVARDLIWLVKRSLAKTTNGGMAWVDLHEEAPLWVQQGRELAKLAYWGLVEQKPTESQRGARTSGIWRPTADGVDFAYGRIAVESHVVLYDNRVLGFTGKFISIRDALRKKFDFDQLWRTI